MIKQSYLNFYFILFITHNLVSAAEIEYYWSGATTEKSAVVSFATDSDAKIRVQYSDNKNFTILYIFRTSCVTQMECFLKLLLGGFKSGIDTIFKVVNSRLANIKTDYLMFFTKFYCEW